MPRLSFANYFRRIHFPLLIAFLASLFYFSYPLGDADLGWHLKYGEYFLKTGHIMRDNQFSWQLPDYQWANHSWGFDVIVAALFNGHRFEFVSLAGGLMVTISLFIVLPATFTIGSSISLIVYWLFGNELINNGFRSQFFSLVATAILWRIMLRWFADTKTVIPKHLFITLPLLFMSWANLHGQFILGLGILGLACVIRFFQTTDRRIKKRLIGLLALCSLATLLNPFTYHLWTTATSHLNAPELKYINEWSPWPLTSSHMIFLLIYTTCVWIGVKWTRQPTTIVVPLAALTVLALTSRRIIPYFLLASLPVIQTAIDMYIHPRLSHAQKVSLLWFITVILGLWTVFTVPPRQLFHQNWDRYCHTNVYCSEKAIQFMRDHHIQGKLWSAYRLGGHLIYRLPELKPMIDGRMTLWHGTDDSSPFLDYTTMVYTFAGAKQLFDQMNPDYVLIQHQYALTKILLTEEQWPIIFSDEQVILFQNPSLDPQGQTLVR